MKKKINESKSDDYTKTNTIITVAKLSFHQNQSDVHHKYTPLEHAYAYYCLFQIKIRQIEDF